MTKWEIVDGPTLTTLDGNLAKPTLKCCADGKRCKHYSVHDWHYEYCSAGPDTAKALRPGAGTQIWGLWESCPYVVAAGRGEMSGHKEG